MDRLINKTTALKGEYRVPGDKSISHRGAILASLAEGKTKITGYSTGADCLATLECLEKLGVNIRKEKENVLEINGKSGLLEEPPDVLDAKNSGTTARLLLGVLSSQKFFSCITGDDSLRKRPMKRVVTPLTAMGAKFYGRQNAKKLPICCLGKQDNAGVNKFELEVASAQVKSSIILAGLYEDENIEIVEPLLTRDHTEKMLQAMGVEISVTSAFGAENTPGNYITLKPSGILKTLGEMTIPGDFSSAAFLLAAAVIKKGSKIIVKDTGINHTRNGFLKILHKMGVKIRLENERFESNEPVADIEAGYEPYLAPCMIDKELVPNVIDELPLFAVLATQAEGVCELRDAGELRNKETDRIEAISSQLKKMGADITANEDGFVVKGPTALKGARVNSFNDHRIAMALAVAGLISEGETVIEDAGCVDISFPGFYDYFT